jgi:hypothetical protein
MIPQIWRKLTLPKFSKSEKAPIKIFRSRRGVTPLSPPPPVAPSLSFDNGFLGLIIGNRTDIIYDGDKYLFFGMRIANVGKIIVAVLHHLELSLNKRLYFANTTLTQSQTLTLFQKIY